MSVEVNLQELPSYILSGVQKQENIQIDRLENCFCNHKHKNNSYKSCVFWSICILNSSGTIHTVSHDFLGPFPKSKWHLGILLLLERLWCSTFHITGVCSVYVMCNCTFHCDRKSRGEKNYFRLGKVQWIETKSRLHIENSE